MDLAKKNSHSAWLALNFTDKVKVIALTCRQAKVASSLLIGGIVCLFSPLIVLAAVIAVLMFYSMRQIDKQAQKVFSEKYPELVKNDEINSSADDYLVTSEDINFNRDNLDTK